MHQRERESENVEGAELIRVGEKYALDVVGGGKRLTVGKNRSDSERKRWECKWKFEGIPLR